MKALIRKIVVASALTIGAVSLAFGADVSQNDVNAVINGLVPVSNVDATVEGTKVILTGYVGSASDKNAIENEVRKIAGVSEVLNEITSE